MNLSYSTLRSVFTYFGNWVTMALSKKGLKKTLKDKIDGSQLLAQVNYYYVTVYVQLTPIVCWHETPDYAKSVDHG